MSNPYEQQPFAQPGPRFDPQPPPPQPGQVPYSPQQLQYLPPQPQLEPQWQSQPQPQPQSQPQWQPQWQSPPPSMKQKNGLAVTALVVSCLALLLVLGLITFVAVTGFFSPPGELQGTAPQVVAGQPYRGALLADELTRVIVADFGDVESMTCPQTPVKADVVVDCHGVVDGYDSTVSVTFEDGLGHFTFVED